MALNGSYQLFHESMEKIKYNREHPPAKKAIEELEKHESDLMPDVDEDPEDQENDPTLEVTVAIREIAKEEKQPIPDMEEHPDGHKNPERLERMQRDLSRLQDMKRAKRVHETFMAIHSTGEYKASPVFPRSPSAGELSLKAYEVQPAQVEIVLCV
jgi:hypothetical protein